MDLVVGKFMRMHSGNDVQDFTDYTTKPDHIEGRGKVMYSVVEAVRLLQTFEMSVDEVFDKASLWCGVDILQRTPGDMYYDYLRIASPVAWAREGAYLVKDEFGGLFIYEPSLFKSRYSLISQEDLDELETLHEKCTN